MDPLRQRCLHHPAREAVARCPQCVRYFCRECVVDHDGRLLCASCLAGAGSTVEAARGRGIPWFIGAVAGIAFGWLFFFYSGSLLTRIAESAGR